MDPLISFKTASSSPPTFPWPSMTDGPIPPPPIPWQPLHPVPIHIVLPSATASGMPMHGFSFFGVPQFEAAARVLLQATPGGNASAGGGAGAGGASGGVGGGGIGRENDATSSPRA